MASLENLVSFSFGFYRNLTNREVTEAASLLSLLEGCNSREGRWDIHFWNPNPRRDFTCKSLFSLLIDPSPPTESVFDVVYRVKVPKKGSLSGKCCLVVLTLWIGMLGRGLRLSGHFVACFVGRRRKILIIFFGIAITRGQCGVLSCRSSVLVLLALGVLERRLRSSFSICHSKIKDFFYGWLVCALLFGTFGVRGMTRSLVVGRGSILRFGLWLDFMFSFGH